MTEFTYDQLRKKSIGELYSLTKLPEETMQDILKIGDDKFEQLVKEKHSIKDDEEINELRQIYDNLIEIIKKYCDIDKKFYPIVACWIIGTYFHESFETYPYLYLNAMKGSGKTRLLKLIADLSDEGEILNSLTEAVLFRSKGTLCIDEFEGAIRKGNENLLELLNSAYKKGTKVKRMKKKKVLGEENQVVEEFDVYRPVALANIYGLDSVLQDRCISIIIERSNRKTITQLVEIWKTEKITTLTKSALLSLKELKFGKTSVVCVDVVSPEKTYKMWNDYVISKEKTTLTTPTTHTTLTTQTTQPLFFNKLVDMEIDGRNLELALPLIIIANAVGDDILEELLKILEEMVKDKRTDDITDNHDISLIDFVSQEPEITYFTSVSEIVQRFKQFLGTNDEWINVKWLGRALKRLGLVKEKRRKNQGREVILNVVKAQEKIRMFK